MASERQRIRWAIDGWTKQVAWLKENGGSDEAIGKAVAGLERAQGRLALVTNRREAEMGLEPPSS